MLVSRLGPSLCGFQCPAKQAWVGDPHLTKRLLIPTLGGGTAAAYPLGVTSRKLLPSQTKQHPKKIHLPRRDPGGKK